MQSGGLAGSGQAGTDDRMESRTKQSDLKIRKVRDQKVRVQKRQRYIKYKSEKDEQHGFDVQKYQK